MLEPCAAGHTAGTPPAIGRGSSSLPILFYSCCRVSLSPLNEPHDQPCEDACQRSKGDEACQQCVGIITRPGRSQHTARCTEHCLSDVADCAEDIPLLFMVLLVMLLMMLFVVLFRLLVLRRKLDRLIHSARRRDGEPEQILGLLVSGRSRQLAEVVVTELQVTDANHAVAVRPVGANLCSVALVQAELCALELLIAVGCVNLVEDDSASLLLVLIREDDVAVLDILLHLQRTVAVICQSHLDRVDLAVVGDALLRSLDLRDRVSERAILHIIERVSDLVELHLAGSIVFLSLDELSGILILQFKGEFILLQISSFKLLLGRELDSTGSSIGVREVVCILCRISCHIDLTLAVVFQLHRDVVFLAVICDAAVFTFLLNHLVLLCSFYILLVIIQLKILASVLDLLEAVASVRCILGFINQFSIRIVQLKCKLSVFFPLNVMSPFVSYVFVKSYVFFSGLAVAVIVPAPLSVSVTVISYSLSSYVTLVSSPAFSTTLYAFVVSL